MHLLFHFRHRVGLARRPSAHERVPAFPFFSPLDAATADGFVLAAPSAVLLVSLASASTPNLAAFLEVGRDLEPSGLARGEAARALNSMPPSHRGPLAALLAARGLEVSRD